MKKTTMIPFWALMAVLSAGCGNNTAKMDEMNKQIAELEAQVEELKAEQATEQETNEEAEAPEEQIPQASLFSAQEEMAEEEFSGDISAEEPATEESSTLVDMKDYLMVMSADYGGDLESQIAEKLGSEPVYNGDFEAYEICDGAIEIYGTTNGSGYFVVQYSPVEGYSAYGISVGMDEKEAKAILNEQGLEESDGTYSTIPDKYYIMYDAEDGKITKVTYVRIISIDK